MTNALYFLIESLRTIITFLFVARFLLQACRADFYNPISQGIVKITDPVLKPLRLLLPGYRNLDFAAFAAALATQILFIYLIMALGGGYGGSVIWIVASALLNVLLFCISVFFWSIIIVIIASFLAPGNYHPALALLAQITEPLLAPARRLLPPMGGLDFSPIIVMLLLGVVERLLPALFQSLFAPV